MFISILMLILLGMRDDRTHTGHDCKIADSHAISSAIDANSLAVGIEKTKAPLRMAKMVNRTGRATISWIPFWFRRDPGYRREDV